MKTPKLALSAALTAALAFSVVAAPAALAVDQPAATTATAPAVPAPGEVGTVPAETAPAESATSVPVPGTAATAEPLPTDQPALPAAEPTEATPTPTPTPEEDYEHVPLGKGHAIPGPNSPLVTDPDGSVHSPVETEHTEPGAGALSRSSADPLGSAARIGGNVRVTLVQVTLADDRRGVNLGTPQSAITDANRYWNTMSAGRVNISVAQTKAHASNARSTDDYWVMMDTIVRELRWVDSPNTALVVFVPTGELRAYGSGGILGAGWSAASNTSGKILMPAPTNLSSNVVTHEFGHVFGLLHANSLQCVSGRSDVGAGGSGAWSDSGCSSREYFDTTDIMGYAQQYHPVINSYFWDRGGFGNGNEILNAGKAGNAKNYTLKPWGGSAANRAVKFTDPNSGETYYLELRQPEGYDAHLAFGGQAGNRGVKIVKADTASGQAVNSLVIPPSTLPAPNVFYSGNHAWQAGQTFRTHTGTTVQINSVNASSASVTITAATPPNVFFNTSPVTSGQHGNSSDQFLSCDWDGDGRATPATYFNGIWTISNNTSGSGGSRFTFGDPGDQPICGDWDGDGRETIGVYRRGVAYLSNSNAGGMANGILTYGDKGDTAIVGDWNRDGFDTLGVSRGEGVAKRFYLTNSNLRPVVEGTFLFGDAGDRTIAGDWDNDGYSTVGLMRGNVWFLSNSNLHVAANQSFAFGDYGDKPLAGKWDRGQGSKVGIAR